MSSGAMSEGLASCCNNKRTNSGTLAAAARLLPLGCRSGPVCKCVLLRCALPWLVPAEPPPTRRDDLAQCEHH